LTAQTSASVYSLIQADNLAQQTWSSSDFSLYFDVQSFAAYVCMLGTKFKPQKYMSYPLPLFTVYLAMLTDEIGLLGGLEYGGGWFGPKPRNTDY